MENNPNDNGYIFDVDLEYPEELHDSHNDYPLAPERLSVSNDMLSDYQLQLMGSHRIMLLYKYWMNC